MEITAIFASAFVVGLSGAMMPGPFLSTVITASTRRGWTTGPLMVLGHGIAELALVVAVMAGLAVFLTNPSVVSVICVLGGGFLLYLGYVTCREAWAGKIDFNPVETGSERNGMNPVLAGGLISVSNPTWTAWWATIGLTYLTLAMNFGWTGVLIFFAGHILADLLWYTLVSGMMAGGRNVLNPRIINGVLVFCGLFLLVMGGIFLYNGIAPLFS